MLFGPAGIPLASKEGGTLDGIRTVSELGLGAMEIEFVRGVHMSMEKAHEAGAEARKLNISLSCHAPYWINCCAKEKVKLARSIHNLVSTAKAAHALGARIIVFHPGFYMGRSSSECTPLVKNTIKLALEKLHSLNIHDVLLGMELTGKPSQYGDIDEIIALASEIPQTAPVIDFAHHHARNNGLIRGEVEYAKLFEKLENGLGSKAVHSFHSHFSEIEYTVKGERRHLELGTSNEPPFNPLMKLLAERGYNGTIICESPLLDQDALKMQRAYRSYSKK